MLGTKILEERESKYNGHLRVLKTIGLGTYIQADGLTQSGGIVEPIWKSTLKCIAYREKRIVKNCLVLGLGGGTVAKLVKKFWPDAKITGVEIDPVMIELGKKYLSLDQVAVSIKVTDAANYTKYLMHSAKYDLMIVDLYNGDKFPRKFEGPNFLSSLRGGLQGEALQKRGGMVIFNRLYFGEKRPDAVKFGKKLEKIFGKVEYFYPEANLMFICLR